MDKQNIESCQAKKLIWRRAVSGLLVVMTMSSLLSGCATTQDTVSTQNDTYAVSEKTALVASNTQEKSDLSKEELLRLFEQFYSDYKKDKVSMDNEMFLVNWTPMPCKSIGTAEDATVYNQIELEVEFTSIDKQLPADGFQQYVEWRTQQEQKVSTPPVANRQQTEVDESQVTPTDPNYSSEGVFIDYSLWGDDAPAQEYTNSSSYGFQYSSDGGIETDWSLWGVEMPEQEHTDSHGYGFAYSVEGVLVDDSLWDAEGEAPSDTTPSSYSIG